MNKILYILALALLVGTVSATNFEFVRQVPNGGPTNFVGTNVISPDDSGTIWTPLQVGDTFTKTNDLGQTVNVPVGAKLPDPTVSNPVLTPAPVVTPVDTPISAPTSTNYAFVIAVPNSGPTNYMGTNIPPVPGDDTVDRQWVPLNVGDTFTKTNDLGQTINVPVGPKIVLQPRSAVNSWLTLSRKGGALRIFN